MEKKLLVAASQLEALRRHHTVVPEDDWYSCPKSGECLDDTADPNKCYCGADEHNARLDAILAQQEAT